jgi:NAD(P)H-hydrate epimerase
MSDLMKYPWIKFPDFIVHPMSVRELRNHATSVIAIGPGIGLSKKKINIVKYLIKKSFPRVVLDADALTIISKLNIKSLPGQWILTPHEGELARLLKIDSKEVKKNRVLSVKKAQSKYGCIILLKGAKTLVAIEDQIFQISSGTKALAKAGSGDVLLGIIAAFYAQGLSGENAAILGSFVHGYSSQLWLAEGNDYLGMRPLDLIELIPKSLLQLRK